MQTNFIPLDYDYFDFNGKNYIKLIGRDDNGKRICVIDDFHPHIWSILKPEVKENKIEQLKTKIEKIEIDSAGRSTKVEKVELHNKKFLGRGVKAFKIFITNYKDAHPIADKLDFPEIDKRRGYDINLISQYIIEKKIIPSCWYKVTGDLLESHDFGNIINLDVDTCIKAEKIILSDKKEFSPKVLAYDIEVDDLELGKGEVLMISLVGKNIKKVLTWKKCTSKVENVEFFKDEADMIEAFVKEIKKYSPDILVGYFSDSFDLPYLRARAEKNKMKLSIGLDSSQPRFSKGRLPISRIDGIIHVDLFKFIEVAYSQYLQSETLSLNEVANELIGERKENFEIKHSSKMKDNEWKDYFKYNLQDSVLTFKLFEKAWPDLVEFSKIMQEPLFSISRDSMSSHVENYIIHNLEKFNEIPEKRPNYDEIGARKLRERYEGAFVFQPKAGLYENICFFDFTSYWPSIIVTFNLSKSTFLEKKEKNSLEVDLGKTKAYFSKEPGFFPLMLKEIIDKRKQYKQEYNKDPNPITKARSNAYKLLANASYGYQGFFGARYYCPEASASATAISRDFTKKTIDLINSKSYEVIYSDTDSIAFKLNKKSEEQTLKLLQEINKNLPGIIELELEDFYKRGIWVTKRTGDFGAKKKYALINHKGKVKIRGFETVRRDWCRLARKLQNEVIRDILEDGNEKKAVELVKKIIQEIKKREIDKKDIIIRTQLKKPISEYKAISPHVIAAKKMMERNLPVDADMLIEFFIAETREKKSLIREMVKLPDEKGEYNIKYYLERQILPAVENILQIFNIDAKQMIDGKKQMKLGEF